uniref:Uncharacterized protein n=1 Tax=Chromulina nebulosa TaxID=96789 RepID=A0A7S0SZD7_9STRA|mmetsp:Transcript_4410/g.3954  ORF Transcript_4410/g.3954 Transcript_4410/m.3954 type:complete len:111 (+) Transcript_4410:2-334(+)
MENDLVDSNSNSSADIHLAVMIHFKDELNRRAKLTVEQSVKEEDTGSDFYNNLHDNLPPYIKNIKGFPNKLPRRGGIISTSPPLYSENLKAVVKVIQYLLTNTAVYKANH